MGGFEAWREWRARRVETVSDPYGPLALTGTYWVEDLPEGRLPDTPGHWALAEGSGVVLTAGAGEQLRLDGEPFSGVVRLGADRGAARVSFGARRLVVIEREGVWGVRDYDPDAEARRGFKGIDVTEYEPRWAVEGIFTPYETNRTVRVENADGKERGLGLGGEIVFAVDGREVALKVGVQPGGGLWAVFADATSGVSSYRFRFLYTGAPDARGRVTVDLNRAELPPCAFSDAFICPFPPPGNRLALAVEAGERTPA